jgi:Fanconi anemia group M protein
MAETGVGEESIDRPLVEAGAFERREYQLALAEAAATEHTLVCLPTGLGKTAVSLLVTAEVLHAVAGKALLLAPTKPLVHQHADVYRAALTIPDEEVVVFTGEVRPDDRAALWEDARVVVATPQVVENDLVGNRISLADVTHCTFDECHRATGEYAYNYIADRYHAEAGEPLVTGMSASPGDDAESILQVCSNLGIRAVEVMTEDDDAVAAYTHDTDVEWITVGLPETVLEIRDALNEVIESRLADRADVGVTSKTSAGLPEREIQRIQGRVQELMDNDQSEGYEAMSLLAEVRKLRTAVTYVETQSVAAFRQYMERLQQAARSSGASKADQRLVSDPRVREAKKRAREYEDLHPKFRRTRMLLAETLGIENGERVIVFTESRDTAEALTDFLGEHFSVARFVGQSDTDGSEGMTQTEQQDVLERFRTGEFEVLVSTSVAEEGLDVPEVDLVLFYEPVPTAIRSIQRKGRTGRQTEGRVVVLIAEDTRDEAYFWKARRDEREMEDQLRSLKSVADDLEGALGGEQAALADVAAAELSGTDAGEEVPGSDPTAAEGEGGDEEPPPGPDAAAGQSDLDSFAGGGADEESAGPDDATEAPPGDRSGEDGGVTPEAGRGEDDAVEIVVDQRELDSAIARDLSTREGIETGLETLAVGDYVLSDRVVVERKTVEDFLDTLTGGDRSIFEQVGDAARHYARPVVVIEGEDLYGARNVHHRAIQGALASLAVDFGASVLQTSGEDETADLLETIARREQEEAGEVSVHGEKQSKTLTEQQEYVVSSVAEVGPVTARGLLAHFGSVEAVMTASEDDLRAVDGVGEVTAMRIREVVTAEYDAE